MRALVIGIGNPDRGDDAAGLIAARGIRVYDVTILESQAEPYSLMEAWRGHETVYLIDACMAVDGPGTIHRFEAHTAPLPERIGALSSHGIGLGTTIELARAMGELPPRLIVFAIEARDYEPGGPVCRSVQEAAARVTEMIEAEIAAVEVA